MKDKKHFYERSNLLESDVNITFEELLWMNDSETTDWIDKMRSFILSQWDDEGIPPTIGQSEEKIKSNFKKLRDYNIQQFLISDDDGNQNVIKNYNKFASGVNQFFPTMLKTTVGKSSIYDWFTDEYKDKCSIQAYWNYYIGEKHIVANLKTEKLYERRPKETY